MGRQAWQVAVSFTLLRRSASVLLFVLFLGVWPPPAQAVSGRAEIGTPPLAVTPSVTNGSPGTVKTPLDSGLSNHDEFGGTAGETIAVSAQSEGTPLSRTEVLFGVPVLVLLLGILLFTAMQPMPYASAKSPKMNSSRKLLTGPTLADEPKEMPEVHTMEMPCRTSRETIVQGWRVKCLPPWTFARKQEDRIFCGLIGGYPAVVVADGASTYSGPDGIVSGGGAEAARIACGAFVGALGKLLRQSAPQLSLESLFAHLHRVLDYAEQEIGLSNRNGDLPGGTTLYFAMLYGPTGYTSKSNGTAYWVYAYIGDGDITLISPSRSIKGWPCETWLASPHSLGGQPVTLPRPYALRNFQPVVGAVPYQPGDILYVASDGLGTYIGKFLEVTRKLTYGKYLWEEMFKQCTSEAPPVMLPDPIAEYGPKGMVVFDDVSVGAIWTEPPHHAET